MAEKFNPQIIVVPDCSDKSSTADLIGKVFTETLRTVYSKELAGRMYFAIDHKEEPEFTSSMEPDVLIFDRTADNTEAADRIRLGSSMNRFGRIFLDIEDPFLNAKSFGKGIKVYTYSADDPDANFYAQKIRKAQDGTGFTFDYVFQSDPKGSGGLKSLFLPSYSQNLISKGSIKSDSRKDIIHAVKAFALGSSAGVEARYISKAVADYDFI